MRYYVTEYKKGRDGKERQYGVTIETDERDVLTGQRILVGKGIFDSYKEAVAVMNDIRKEERMKAK